MGPFQRECDGYTGHRVLLAKSFGQDMWLRVFKRDSLNMSWLVYTAHKIQLKIHPTTHFQSTLRSTVRDILSGPMAQRFGGFPTEHGSKGPKTLNAVASSTVPQTFSSLLLVNLLQTGQNPLSLDTGDMWGG